MDYNWAVQKLETFIQLVDDYYGMNHPHDKEARDEAAKLEPVVREIANIVRPGAGDYQAEDEYYDRWNGPRTLALEILGRVQYGEEIERHLHPGPRLQASSLHPNVWDAAKSLWRTNHRREAVGAAARSVNAALQDTLNRRDISEAELVRQAFSRENPAPGKPRLRFSGDRGSRTWVSKQDGAMQYGAGCFMAIRNVLAHEAEEELTEYEGLERLAAFSLLARWIDMCDVELATL
jgi:hypothetical protein